jgi:hypothetical protein
MEELKGDNDIDREEDEENDFSPMGVSSLSNKVFEVASGGYSMIGAGASFD